MTTDDWNRHAARAEALQLRHASASELLGFYAKLARFLSTDPAWPALLEWGVANGNTEIAAVANEAVPGDESLFAQIFRLARHAAHDVKTTPPWPSYCACCGGRPGVSVLRPEADGSRRSLICSACLYEWPYQRILCPNCEEQRFEELPVYIAEEFAHLRVECCATCKRYLLSADLLKDPEAIPEVEDIAAISLHLWAADRGYTKIELNLFGY